MIGISIIKVLRHTAPIILGKSVLTCCKAEFASFFSIWVFFHKLTIHMKTGEGGDYLFI